MNKILTASQLTINSDNIFILFQLDDFGKIKYSLYDNFNNFIKTFTIDIGKVLNYSVTIDQEDTIHLITLTESGELIHSIYNNNTWSNTIISKLNLQSNIYKDIDFKIFNNNINILYNYANVINPNLWTIQHILNHNNTWIRHNVINLYANINTTYFSLDIDSFGILHLLYTTIDKNNIELFHKSYNPFSQKWSRTPQRVSFSENDKKYPYIFIDTKNNLHGLWLETINNSDTLKYYRLSPKLQGKYIWEEIKIPHISNCNNPPIIFEENGILKIVYTQNNKIGFLYSTDYGNNWHKGDTLTMGSKPIHFVKVSTHAKKYKNLKINHLYCYIDSNQPIFYFIETFDNRTKEQKNIPANKDNKDIDSNNKDKTNQSIEQILTNQNEIKDILYKIGSTQTEIKENTEKILTILNDNKGSFLHKFFKPN